MTYSIEKEDRLLSYDFNDHQPIYLQLLEIFKIAIANASWTSGSKVDSVRNLALQYGVNPNTVQRALQELEREGLAYTERTAGRYITEDNERIRSLRQTLGELETQRFVQHMQELNMTEDSSIEMIRKHWERNKEDKND